MSEKRNDWLIGAIVGAGALTALAAWGKAKRRFDFTDKVILITGGSRGLGLVLAREFAGEGSHIAICARDGAELGRAREDLENRGAEVFEAVCDVRDRDEVVRLVEGVKARFGGIDVLVNNAGIIQVGPLAAQTQGDFEDALATHFWGPFYAMQAVLPLMREKGAGRIVNISSIGGKVAVPHLAPYCASKHALVGLSNAMRAELVKDNIYVTTVCPGLMRTGSHVNATFKGQNEKEFALFSLADATPLSSISAERAAKQIIRAARDGQAELIISLQAQLAAKANALFPELTADILSLVDQLLPMAGGIGRRAATGLKSASSISPSIITSAIDRAAVENNELKPNEQIN